MLRVNYTDVYNSSSLIINEFARFNYFTVNWGDGSAVQTFVDSAFANYYPDATPINFSTNALYHDFPQTDTEYTVSISGNLYGFSTLFFNPGTANNENDKINTRDSLIKIKKWGCLKLADYRNPGGLTNPTSVAFFQCVNFIGFDDIHSSIDIPDLSLVTSLQSYFNGCSIFNGDITKWDVSNVTELAYMLWLCFTFNQDLSLWNIQNVTIFSSCFHGNYSFSPANRIATKISWQNKLTAAGKSITLLNNSLL
jgi:surface protein